jgi:hypothetical protein
MHVTVVLGRLPDRALGLPKCPVGRVRRVRQRSPECADEKLIGILVERKGGRLARTAYDATGRS